MRTTRREVLRTGWKIGTGLLTVAAGWTSWELLRPLTAVGAGGKLKLGSPSNFAKGTATYVNAGRFYVANAGGHLFALSQKCTHLGCRVEFDDKQTRFRCPCHGSVFDIGGEWISGPAPRGMDRYELSVADDTLIADTGRKITGPEHGANQYQSMPTPRAES
jgi:cytochrome b6-f complex iron-sulfur subunit